MTYVKHLTSKNKYLTFFLRFLSLIFLIDRCSDVGYLTFLLYPQLSEKFEVFAIHKFDLQEA